MGGGLNVCCELLGDKVTVNVIMRVTTLEALTVTSFAGEEEDRMRFLRCHQCLMYGPIPPPLPTSLHTS